MAKGDPVLYVSDPAGMDRSLRRLEAMMVAVDKDHLLLVSGTGDVILAVKGEDISSQTGFYRKLWSLGAAGVDVPLTVYHEGVTFDVVLTSTDRARLLKAPRLH